MAQSINYPLSIERELSIPPLYFFAGNGVFAKCSQKYVANLWSKKRGERETRNDK